MLTIKKVLIVTTTGLGYEGIAGVIFNYLKNMDLSEIKLDFVLSRPTIDFVKEEIKKIDANLYLINNRTNNPFLYIKNLRKIIEKNHYDIVHVHGNSATMYFDIHAARLAGVPVRIAHTHSSSCKSRIVHEMLKPLLKRELTHAFACSDLAGKFVFNDNFDIVYNGVDIEKFLYNSKVRAEYREKLGLTDNFVLGHIGYFSDVKNHDFLIDVFNEVYKLNPKARLLLIGDGGNLKPIIQEKVKSFCLEKFVLFLGKRNDVNMLMQALDVFLLPSKYEGLPVSLVEAQCSGLHCFISDTITKDVEATDRLHYMSLKESCSVWANEILKFNDGYERRDVKDKIFNSHFNIKNEARKLQEFYLEIEKSI